MADSDIPTEALEAAALAYDQAVNAALGNPPGTVLGEVGRARFVEHPAFRAAIAAAAPHFIAQGRAETIAQLRDDERYRNWWSTLPPGSPDIYWHGPGRRHLADYLETIGPDHG